MKKKEISIIIIASLLILILALTTFYKTTSNNTNTKVDTQETLMEEPNNNIFELSEEEKNRPTLDSTPSEEAREDIKEIRQNIKKYQKQKSNNVKTAPIELNNKNITKTFETKLEDNETQDNNTSDNVIVPVSYTTRNTYKYVYTPSNFNK